MRNTDNRPIRTTIQEPGQRYVDVPQYSGTLEVSKLAKFVAAIYNFHLPGKIPVFSHYERQPIVWRKPEELS